MTKRLDTALVELGLVRSRERAKDAIREGLVRINGTLAKKPGQDVKHSDVVTCEGETHDYVSRGALKLEAGLEAFGVPPQDLICLDLGASTGGFTEVLLRHGAARVYAVDVGTGQLHPDIAGDGRVVNLQQTHAKDISPTLVPDPIELLVCDVSFISIMKALPTAFALCGPGAHLVTLVKPQFELGPGHIGKGGIVSLPVEEQRQWVIDTILPWLEGEGWIVDGLIDSPIKGGDGNTEFLVGARRHGG